MNYEELLHEYFDGGLDEQREAALFMALSHDDGLRREFGDFMQLRNVARNEAVLAALPADLTAAVFSGLGYQLDPVPDATAIPLGAPPPASGRLASLFPYIATSVLSSLFTALIVVFLLRSDDAPQAVTESTIQVQPSEAALPPPVATGSEEVLSAKQSPLAGVDYSLSSPPATAYRSAGQRESLEASAAASTVAETSLIPITNAIVKTPDQHIGIADRISNKEALYNETEVSSLFFLTDAADQFDISLRSSAALSFPSVDIPTQSQGRLSTFAVSALYILSDEHAAGIEFGREAFAQRFTQTLRGERATILQNPTLWWGAASYRYTPEALRWESLIPFTQLALGATPVGPFGRLKCGVHWIPESHVVFSSGVEGSALMYPVEGTLYTTTKVGVFYGIGIRF